MQKRPDRIMLLKVPLDIVSPEDLPEVIFGMLTLKKNQSIGRLNIVLLSLWDLLRARRNKEYREYVLNAALVLPISKRLVSGAKFLTKKQVFRYMPFNFVISLLSILERKEFPVFLLGGRSWVLKKTEKNISSTFPQIKIVGRSESYMRKREEHPVIEAIRKSSPSLLLAGEGIRGEELWIARNSERLNLGFRLWCSDLFDVFAEKKRRPSDKAFEQGIDWIGHCFKNPLKIFRAFSFLRYNFLLLLYKIFRIR
jgi:N-acetylglucosaminyldiphosphoundecaprenol N-acetyl-beta-D-mannosaminyltransferase